MDTLPDELSEWAHRLPIGSTVLDLGCGRGQNAIALAQLGFNVTGIDISANAIADARRKAEACGSAVRFIVADILSFRCEQTFDLVYDYSVFHHIHPAYRPLYAATVVSCMAHSASFVLVCYSRHDPASAGRAFRLGEMGNPIAHLHMSEIANLFGRSLKVRHYAETRLGRARRHHAYHVIFSRIHDDTI